MHAVPLSEPPVSPASPYAYHAPRLVDQRRVMLRLRDGEDIQIGVTQTREEGMALARKTMTRIDTAGGDWPVVGDRFINRDAIVSVDVLRWG